MEWQWVVVIGLVILLILGVRFTGAMGDIAGSVAKSEHRPKVDEARSILENRYALGELDDDEFARRLEVLSEERKRDRQRRLQRSE